MELGTMSPDLGLGGHLTGWDLSTMKPTSHGGRIPFQPWNA